VTTYPFSVLWPESPAVPGHPQTRGPVVVGSDVWLGFGCTILSGVTIGDGAVVGAGAVVRDDVAPYAIVTGNPATEVRKRFDPQTVTALLEIAWWTWDDDAIARALPTLQAGDVHEFIARARAGDFDRHE
jgi:chloramphenicol O-acetyltransferase type B